jgi:aldehyde dehydrogenase (NAD+)
MSNAPYRCIRGPGSFTTWNPARPDERIGEYGADSGPSVQDAVARAARAYPSWRRLPAAQRAGRVAAWLDKLSLGAEDIARAIVLEQGKPLVEARGELAKALAEARFMVSQALHGGTREAGSARQGTRNLVLRRPRGVVAALTPWNFPILTPLRKIVPSLVAGNTVVIKPSELAPAAVYLALSAAAGVLPEGVLQLVLGAREAGEALVSAAGLCGVSFTGSVATGRALGAVAGTRLIEQNLELGGKNGAIVSPAADPMRAAAQIAQAAFLCAGQRCTAISRAIIHVSQWNAFVGALRDHVDSARLGDGLDAATTLGPLVSADHRDKVEAMVEQARHDGAQVLAGGARAHPAGCEAGHFYRPTLLQATPEMACAREEIFGPVLALLRYERWEDALAMLNGTEYGLAAALFSRDPAEVDAFVHEAEAGMLFVNQGTLPDNHMPFVGVKASGVGPGSVGPSALGFATTEHAVYLSMEQVA